MGLPYCFLCRNKKTQCHVVPTKGFKRKAWAESLGLTDLPDKGRICSDHFSADDYTNHTFLKDGQPMGVTARLKPGALPKQLGQRDDDGEIKVLTHRDFYNTLRAKNISINTIDQNQKALSEMLSLLVSSNCIQSMSFNDFKLKVLYILTKAENCNFNITSVKWWYEPVIWENPVTWGDHVIPEEEEKADRSAYDTKYQGSSEDIVAVLNTLLNAKTEAEQISTELHSHTHLPWCNQQINKMDTLHSSLDDAIRSLQRCVGIEDELTTIYLPEQSNDDIKHEHSFVDTKDMVISTEDNSTIKTEMIESEEIKTELITVEEEEISNDDSEFNDEDNFEMDHFLSVNILEKDEMKEFEADDKVEGDIHDNFDQEENRNIDENILARNKRKAENQGNSPRKKITGSYEKQSEKSSSILSSLPSNQSETTF